MSENAFKDFLNTQGLTIVKIEAAPGNQPDYYCAVSTIEQGRALCRELEAVGASGFIGSYPPSSDNMAVNIDSGAEKLEALGVVNSSFAQRVHEETVESKTR